MSTQPEQAKAEILQQIVATINEKVPEDRREQVEEFARQYYQRLAPEDLLELEPDDLYGAALAHWRLAHRRQPGEAKVRVYNPDFERARLAVAAHVVRDRQRRHAVPGRLGGHGAEPAGLRLHLSSTR